MTRGAATQDRFARLNLLRAALAMALGPIGRRTAPERRFRRLCPLATAIACCGRLARFQTADALDPDLRGVALRELARACRTAGAAISPPLIVDNEAELRSMQAAGRRTLWCGLHHALAGVMPSLFEAWLWPAAGLTAHELNPAWGDSESCRMIRPSTAGLLAIRRAILEGRATLAILDAGRQPRTGVVASTGLLELARRLDAIPVAFRADLDSSRACIRIHTRIGPSPALPAARFQAQARAAVEHLYSREWGVRILWRQRPWDGAETAGAAAATAPARPLSPPSA